LGVLAADGGRSRSTTGRMIDTHRLASVELS
jgi:hypothetical protein